MTMSISSLSSNAPQMGGESTIANQRYTYPMNPSNSFQTFPSYLPLPNQSSPQHLVGQLISLFQGFLGMIGKLLGGSTMTTPPYGPQAMNGAESSSGWGSILSGVGSIFGQVMNAFGGGSSTTSPSITGGAGASEAGESKKSSTWGTILNVASKVIGYFF